MKIPEPNNITVSIKDVYVNGKKIEDPNNSLKLLQEIENERRNGIYLKTTINQIIKLFKIYIIDDDEYPGYKQCTEEEYKELLSLLESCVLDGNE